MNPPAFAVVGHVNKGKSSVVATLAEDVAVAIDRMPGTTTTCRAYPFRIDGETVYTLIDTPGFEQAVAALHWLQQHESDSSQRPAVVRAFVAEPGHEQRFPEECELLKPVLDGAAILYVVDGSRPYSPEYEAEMEILRWSGNPRMALINRIGDEDHVGDWRAALDQYFSLVRTFNAHQADFHARIQLLEAVRELRDEWRPSVERAVEALKSERARRVDAAARSIAAMLTKMLQLDLTKRLSSTATDDDLASAEQKLRDEYFDALRKLERRCRRDVEEIFAHADLDRMEQRLELFDEDLFNRETWNRLGLTERQLIIAGVAGGALAGGAFDAAVGGASFMTGAMIGSVLGGVSGWYSGRKLPQVKLAGLPMGGKQARIGPMSNPQFPWVVLDRALLHARVVANRPHARRDELNLQLAEPGAPGIVKSLPGKTHKAISRVFHRLRTASPESAAELQDEVRRHLAALLDDL